MTKAKQLILPISYPDSGRWDAPVRKIKIDEPKPAFHRRNRDGNL